MPKALTEAIASSSAHGISRAAATKATPLRVMWILLFIVFLALFLKSGIKLVLKLHENKLTKVYHLDQVSFVFPDLYFCPNNPYSGSFPFMLTKKEAGLLNAEVSRLVDQTERKYNISSGASGAYTRAMQVQLSFPFHLFKNHLVLRQKQSVLDSSLTSDFMKSRVDFETFFTPENLVCFKPVLNDELKAKMMNPSSSLEIFLSTDPYFADFNYTGHQILPITDAYTKSFPFLTWHPTKIVESLKVSGYKMLIVPPGAYPALRFENTFHLAPGNAYSLKLQMEENACSEELHRTHCVKDHPQVAFTNPLTGEPELFNYSSAACYYLRKNTVIVDKAGCQMSLHPSLWKFREWPHCLNGSEMSTNAIARVRRISVSEIAKLERDVNEHCKSRIPCSYPQYSASYSFGKWPSIGSSTDHYFANSFRVNNESEMPALARLVKIAKQIQGGNHSAHLEGIFRSYVSESLVSVSISAASVSSPQVMLTWSYSLTDFLADTGGLLGLYIGCSMLTLCELLELFYILMEHSLKRRPVSRDAASGRAESGDDQNCEKMGPEAEVLTKKSETQPAVAHQEEGDSL